MLKNVFFFLVLTLFSFGAFAQDNSPKWFNLMADPTKSLYEIQESFYTYWQSRTIEKGKGYKAFKRWENYMEPRVYPTGDITLPSQTYPNYLQWEQDNIANGIPKSLAGNWQPLGPVGAAGGGGAGRLNFIRFHPSNSNILFVGAPDGGLWKSENGGQTWATNTDQLTVIGCSDIAIDPTNPSVMYLATGDGDASDTYSVGVLKSIDGGETWNTTGLSFTVNQGRTLSRLLIHPTDPNTLLAVGSNGIWRTTNGGTSWTVVSTATGFKDAEFHPTNPSIVYAAGTSFRRSTDGGVTWNAVSIPLSGINRIAIGVTPANPNYVYLLASDNNDSGFRGLMRSTNEGASFTTRSTTPNVMGWDDGGDAGGQGWYDLAIAVSPTNAEDVFVGGVNMWRSTNGGTNWTLNSHWYGGFSKPYVHADIHDIAFLPGSGNTLFSANDGGLFKSTNTGSSWTDISGNLNIAQQYRFGLSTTNANLLITGHQDNGTNRMSGTSWTQVYGGDGMDCFIDRTNNNNMFGSYVYGDYYRSTNGGNSWNSIADLPGGEWLSTWHQDPITAATIYAGGRPELYKSTNSGGSWTALGTPTGNGSITEFAIAPSNNQIIYALKTGSAGVSKSTNGGTSFASVNTGLPTTLAPTYVAVSNTDPNRVYVTYSGYTAANKVYVSTNGGTSWTNISTGLPNVAANTIVYHNDSQVDAVYVGTDVGVFYRDNTMSNWIQFSNNLPRVAVRDLEIFYPTGRLRAATYGRGTWDSDLYSSEAAGPIASFTASSTTVCAGQTVTFTNTSLGDPTTFAWSFPGGTPSTSTEENPTITYPSAGTYTVELVASNDNGSGANTQTDMITVNAVLSANLPIEEGFVDANFPPTNWTIINPNASQVTWARDATLGTDPTAGNSMVFDNYAHDDAGEEDIMQFPSIDLSEATTASLSFDVAYAPYDATYFDGLKVTVSTTCGGNLTVVYQKSGTDLATAPAIQGAFSPQVSEWRRETIDLTPYLGESSVIVSFHNLAGYGNRIFVDNIMLEGEVSQDPPVAGFTAAQTVVCAGQTVQFTNTSTGAGNSYSWTFPGGTPATSTDQNPFVTYANAGIFSVELAASNPFGTNSLNEVSYLQVSTTPEVNSTLGDEVCGSGTLVLNATASEGTLSWYAAPTGGSALATGTSFTSPTISATTTYYVEASNGVCSSERQAVVATVNPNPTITIQAPQSIICLGNSVTLTAQGGDSFVWSSGLGSGAAVTVSPTITTSYSVVGTNATTSCSASATLEISVTDAIEVAVSASQTEICAGEAVVLTASGASTYSWSPGGQTGAVISVNPTTTTSYMVTGVMGCSDTEVVTITVNPAPTVTLSSLPTVCVTDNTFILNQGSPSGGTYSGNGVTGTSFNPIEAGVGNILITYEYGIGACVGEVTAILVVDACASLTEEAEDVLMLFPNPTEGMLIIAGEKLESYETIELIDLQGRKVAEWEISATEMILNVSPYAAGTYSVRVTDGKKVIQKTVVLR
jgi:PKD repeat protein